MWCQGTLKVYDSIQPHLFDDPDNVLSQNCLWYPFRESTIEDERASRNLPKYLNLLCDVASYGSLSLLSRWTGGTLLVMLRLLKPNCVYNPLKTPFLEEINPLERLKALRNLTGIETNGNR